jgi:TPR repeat protein
MRQHPWVGTLILGACSWLSLSGCAPNGAPADQSAQATYKKQWIVDDAPNAVIALGDKALSQRDYPGAIKRYEEASADADIKVQASALNRLGELYERGEAVDRDLSRSFGLYKKAALLGNPYAQANLGNSLFFASGTPRDLVEALRWAEKGADADVTMAINQVGWQFLRGMGVAADTDEARRRYARSAQLGDATGQEQLGWMYAHIDPMDYQQAMHWYQKAAEQNDETAQNNIGYLYENGLGVTQDYGEAARWYQLSAGAGFARAQFHLGILYDSGLGVNRDTAKARDLMQKAADSGDAEAAKWLRGRAR